MSGSLWFTYVVSMDHIYSRIQYFNESLSKASQLTDLKATMNEVVVVIKQKKKRVAYDFYHKLWLSIL